MTMPDTSDKSTQDGMPGTSYEPPPRSGEGAETALQALLRKRRSNGDDPPSAHEGNESPGASPPA
jgi:hypothetical protein